ncbi:MAG: dockerin type I repeat-containing protein [Phycisphaerae bacterium]|nr:dockerin type I repeat-containing protein [Phycisphaerae bacterium]
MNTRIPALLTLALVALAAQSVLADCPLDHYFFYQVDNRLTIDKRRIYVHGDPAEGYYPLSWSGIYGRWSVGEPGFSDTTDAAYGFPTELQLVGEPGTDYEINFEILDLSPDFKIQMNDGTWLETIGDRYNLSAWAEHHVHMKYCAYVSGSPAPDYPFYVTYRLVDDFGMYAATPPFSLVFNMPTPTVEATEPEYRGVLTSLTAGEITFTFHRPIAIVDGPPVTITDEATHTADYYAGHFDYSISPDGLTLTLTQTGGTLPNETWLAIALTEHTRDAVTDCAAVAFTHYVYTAYLAGDCDGDQDVDAADFASFEDCMLGPEITTTACDCADIDGDTDVDLVDFVAIQRSFTGALN